MGIPAEAYTAILPEAVLTFVGMLILAADPFARSKRAFAGVALIGLLAAVAAVIPSLGRAQNGDLWGGMIALDDYSVFFKVVFLGASALVVLLGARWAERRNVALGEYHALVVFATLGMLLMAGSRDLMTIYLGLELASISSYVLAGMLRGDARSNEAAIKYFLNGALASSVLLFGLSLLFGLTGTTYLPAIADATASPNVPRLPLYAAIAFLVGGFGFKVAAAPFHFWAPDAYDGAPTPVTAFFSVGPKGAMFAAILRTFMVGLPELAAQWSTVFGWLAVLSMTLGNLTALYQTNIKRMMAYSSIAHAGYMLVGVAVARYAFDSPGSPVMYYVLAYVLTNLGAFAVITALDAEAGPNGAQVRDFAGLYQRSPLLAWAMLVFFVSLIGIPPTAGFLGKFLIFRASVIAEQYWLAIAIALNSAISVGYYYGVVRNMFLVPAAGAPHAGSDRAAAPRLPVAPGIAAAVVVAVVGTIGVGLVAQPFVSWAQVGAALLVSR